MLNRRDERKGKRAGRDNGEGMGLCWDDGMGWIRYRRLLFYFRNGSDGVGVMESNKTFVEVDSHGTLHVVSDNSSVPFAVNGVGVFEAMSTMAKCMQTVCPVGYYRSGCSELMSEGKCIPCPPCPNHQYRSRCMLMGAGICLNVTTCGTGKFEARAATSTSDRQCDILPSTSTVSPSRNTTTTGKSTSTTFSNPCSETTNTILNCADASSRATITSNNICEVARVDNCCRNEVSSLNRVSGDVNVRRDETMLYFGTIRGVGVASMGEGHRGAILGHCRWLNLVRAHGWLEMWS